jgi:hypothetical protein
MESVPNQDPLPTNGSAQQSKTKSSNPFLRFFDRKKKLSEVREDNIKRESLQGEVDETFEEFKLRQAVQDLDPGDALPYIEYEKPLVDKMGTSHTGVEKTFEIKKPNT